MTFSKAVISALLAASWGMFVWQKTTVTAAVFALCLLTFFITEAFGTYEKMARFFSSQLSAALDRAEKNEERIKQLVEAGVKMSQKVNEIDMRMTQDAVGRFAGVKR